MKQITAAVLLAFVLLVGAVPVAMAHHHYHLYISIEPSIPVPPGSVTYTPYKQNYNNEDVTLTAFAATGWAFDHWSGDISGSQNPTVIYMNSDKYVTANFVETAPQYAVTVIILPSVQYGVVTKNPDQQLYYYDQTVILTANANEGYYFDHWGGDIGSANPTDDPISVATNSNKNLNCYFFSIPVAAYSLTVIYYPSDSGTVMQSPPPDPGSNKYDDGTVVTLTALGSNPYLFDHWGTDLSGSTNPTTITMNGDKQVDVYFTLPPPIIDSFGAIPASLQKGGNVNLSWMTQYTDQVTLFLNDVNQGVYDGQTSSFTVTITQTTVAYIVAEGDGGSTTSEKVTITVGDSPPLSLPTTNIGDNWILLIIAIAAILLGLFLFIRWVKKPKIPVPEKKSSEKKKFDIKQLIKR